MSSFSLTTRWKIPAPVDNVWEVIIDTESWPLWWQYVQRVDELEAGYSSGINNRRRYYWSTCLPYQLILDLCITRIEPYHLIETQVSGDLTGTGSCCLTTEKNITVLQYQWNVALHKPWMNWIGPIARPIFTWNHKQVMKQGEKNLILRLDELSK